MLDLPRRRPAWRARDVRVPDPVAAIMNDDAEREAVLADSIGLALLVVLDTPPRWASSSPAMRRVPGP